MNKYLKLVFLAIMVLFVSSCSQEEISIEDINQSILEKRAQLFDEYASNIQNITNGDQKNINSQLLYEFQSNRNFLTDDEIAQLQILFDVYIAEQESQAQIALDIIRSYGLTDNEILFELGYDPSVQSLTDVKPSILIEAANLIISIDGTLNPNLYQTRSQVFDCALQAIGVTAVLDLINNGVSNMSKGAVKKILKKVASKYLGWVGAAIAVYEFGDCMNYW